MIRRATRKDCDDINAIYNHYVQHSELTFDVSPRSDEQGKAWFATHDHSHPVFVWDEQEIRGWACLSRWSTKSGYDRTVELSIFVHPEFLGQRMGQQLFDALLREAAVLSHHTILSRITSENLPSIKLHENAGFKNVGYMREVGFKNDRWLDVYLFQLILSETKSAVTR